MYLQWVISRIFFLNISFLLASWRSRAKIAWSESAFDSDPEAWIRGSGSRSTPKCHWIRNTDHKYSICKKVDYFLLCLQLPASQHYQHLWRLHHIAGTCSGVRWQGFTPPGSNAGTCCFLHTKSLHIKSTEQCLASSELLTPHPLSLHPASVSSPRTKGGGGGGTHSPCRALRGGMGGQYFGRRQTLDWPLTV